MQIGYWICLGHKIQIDQREEVEVIGACSHSADAREVLIKSYGEFIEKQTELEKEKKKDVFDTW